WDVRRAELCAIPCTQLSHGRLALAQSAAFATLLPQTAERNERAAPRITTPAGPGQRRLAQEDSRPYTKGEEGNMERRLRGIRVLWVSILGLLMSILVGSTSIAYANCFYNGKTYSPGARFGPSICMPNGSWQPPIQQPPAQPPLPQVQQ